MLRPEFADPLKFSLRLRRPTNDPRQGDDVRMGNVVGVYFVPVMVGRVRGSVVPARHNQLMRMVEVNHD